MLLSGLKLPINQNQFDALISFCFNVGFGALKSSSLLRAVKSKEPDSVIKYCFSMWCKAGGKELRRLVARRKEEGNLFCSTEL